MKPHRVPRSMSVLHLKERKKILFIYWCMIYLVTANDSYNAQNYRMINRTAWCGGTMWEYSDCTPRKSNITSILNWNNFHVFCSTGMKFKMYSLRVLDYSCAFYITSEILFCAVSFKTPIHAQNNTTVMTTTVSLLLSHSLQTTHHLVALDFIPTGSTFSRKMPFCRSP